MDFIQSVFGTECYPTRLVKNAIKTHVTSRQSTPPATFLLSTWKTFNTNILIFTLKFVEIFPKTKRVQNLLISGLIKTEIFLYWYQKQVLHCANGCLNEQESFSIQLWISRFQMMLLLVDMGFSFKKLSKYVRICFCFLYALKQMYFPDVFWKVTINNQ